MEIPTLEQMWEISQDHIKSDKEFQKEFRDFMVRAEPVLKAFENKRIVKMTIEEDTKTITFYVKSALTVGTMLVGLWAIIKFALNK